MEQVILYIDQSYSYCGACGKGCMPHEKTHRTMAGYQDHGKPGCGAKYTHLSTHYLGGKIKVAAQNIRPDLPWYPRPSDPED
jgi:hypothetical protein